MFSWNIKTLSPRQKSKCIFRKKFNLVLSYLLEKSYITFINITLIILRSLVLFHRVCHDKIRNFSFTINVRFRQCNTISKILENITILFVCIVGNSIVYILFKQYLDYIILILLWNYFLLTKDHCENILKIFI